MLVSKIVIGTSCGVPTSGYVAQLFLIDVAAVTMIAASNLECTKVEVEEISNLYEIKLLPKNCVYNESNFEDGDGNGFQVSFGFGQKDSNPGLYDWLWANQNRRWIALFEGVNGGKYIVGEVRNGLQATFSKADGRIGIALKGRLSLPALKVESLDPDVLFLQSEFVPTDFLENDFII